MKGNWMQVLSQPQENGIVIFISGFLLALGLYHLLLYFQNKDQAYLYYALYALLVFSYTFHRASNFVLADLAAPYRPFIEFLYDPIKWLYATVYMFFAVSFVDLDRYFPKFIRYLKIFLKISLSFLGVLLLVAIALSNKKILDYGYNFGFLPIIFILSLYILFLIYRSKSPVKYYLLIGAGTYLLVTSYSHYLTYTGRPFRVLFYAATAFEMILFALGLGHKQKLIMEEKNLWQTLIIKEHEKNLALKDDLTKKLGEEVSDKIALINTLKREKRIAEQNKLAVAYSKQILQLRLQAVQAQMNPHFLFNALNAIKMFIIKNDQKQAVTYLTKFAKLIRMVLNHAKIAETSLKDELDLIKLYVDVENIRFNQSIDFKIDIDEHVDINQIKVPPMIFQALIENAIWHGLAPKKGEKKLQMHISKKMPYIKISIEDNGIGRKKAQDIQRQKNKTLKKESMGIKITEERLAVYTQAFKNKFKINFIDLYNDQQPAGTRVNVCIPIA